MRNIRCRKQFS